MIAAPPEPVRPPPCEIAARPRHSPWPYRRRLWLGAGIALALHGAVWFFGGAGDVTQVEFGMEDPVPSVDIEIVEQAGADAAPELAPPVPEPPVPEPPKPEPPKPEPEPPVPVPEPPKPDPEAMAEPKPEPAPIPKPRPVATPIPKPRSTARPATAARPSASQSASGAAATGSTGGGRTAGPGHLYNPKPPYPAESRAAGEEGVVILRVLVEASGRPGSVGLSRSSGHPRLDRAAQEAVRRWRFKPATRNGVAFSTTVDVPVRFSLR